MEQSARSGIVLISTFIAIALSQAEKFNKKEGSAKSNVQPSDVSDWSEMLGVSLAPSKTTQVISGLDISGSIRARNFAIVNKDSMIIVISHYLF